MGSTFTRIVAGMISHCSIIGGRLSAPSKTLGPL
jgi:hypothetical protein